MGRTSKWSEEVQERAVRMVYEHRDAYATQWAAISSISEKIGCSPETLRRWIRRDEVDMGQRARMTHRARPASWLRKALVETARAAVGHSIPVIAYHLIDRDEVYSDLGADYFIQRQTSVAHRNRLVRQLRATGHKVTLQDLPDAA